MNKSTGRSLLIIFYRNPGLGKVKTRLAATIGEEKALAVYTLLTTHTIGISTPLEVDKVVYYSDYVDREDNWANGQFHKQLQKGGDLGERMLNAFADGFSNGYESICIIGTDCFELTSEIIAKALRKLETKDAVIGPAHDGGYYLLGMNNLLPTLFKDKRWGTSSVYADTIVDLKALGQNFFQLELLNDIDREQDLPAAIRKVISGQ